ncbi:MAG: hypothetical protein LBF68_03440 [Christensenellaceae bacterium]|jgi:hypothetical protein|nr:hypothetical protein [Christensenellaceae bacterium]
MKIRGIVICLIVILSIILTISQINLLASAEESVDSDSKNIKITFGQYLYANGALEYLLTYDFDLLGAEDSQNNELAKSLSDTILVINDLYSGNGFSTLITLYSVNITLLKYDNYTDYYIANGITGYDDTSSNNNVKTEFFYKSYYSNIKNPFVEEDPNALFNKALQQIMLIDGIDLSNIEYYFIYGTKYAPSYISLTADNPTSIDVTYDINNDIYVHTVKFKENHLDDITLVNKVPNTLGWYSVVLIIAGVLITAMVIFVRLRNKKNGTPDIED